ncbi:MAG: hypothetical protein JJ900_16870 [Rhodospirillales bacterium]|nr:hypothetical protein [Rhodospirillales bacterium]MBO6788522.1 hypothetical protein [Rhodospirillales bacterium]
MKLLKSFVGLTVEKVASVHDYIQIHFSDGSILTVNNGYSTVGGEVHSFEGAQVLSATDDDRKFIINFDNERTLCVGLTEEFYANYPEAMHFVRGDDICVWN